MAEYELDEKPGEEGNLPNAKDLIDKIEVGDSISSMVVISQGLVLFGALNKTFYALDKETGRPAWEFRTGGQIFWDVGVYGDKVYFGSFDGYFYRLTIADGKLVWKYYAGNRIVTGATIADGKVHFGCDDGTHFCLSLEGGLLWKFKVPLSR